MFVLFDDLLWVKALFDCYHVNVGTNGFFYFLNEGGSVAIWIYGIALDAVQIVGYAHSVGHDDRGALNHCFQSDK